MGIHDDRQSLTATAPEATSSTPQRPAGLPEGFENVDQLARAYTALEREQEQSKQEQPSDVAPQDDTNGIPSTGEQAAELLASVDLDYGKFAAEFMADGQLSALSYAELASKGISADVAHQFIAGQQALANSIRADVLAPVGGEAKYAEMVGWAADSLSDAEKRAYNAVMEGGDTAAMKLAAEGLKSRFEAVNGVRPTVWLGGSTAPGASASDLFSSTKELTTAMSDPRYAADPAYRQDVINRLGRSKIL